MQFILIQKEKSFAQSAFESKLLPRNNNVEVINVISELASDEYILYL